MPTLSFLTRVALVWFFPSRCKIKENNNFIQCALCRPRPSLVLCPGPPVLSLFCLGTGGCQSGFMSSSLELKEVSFMSCYGTRRLGLSGVMRSGPGEPGEAGEAGSGNHPLSGRPAVRKSKRLLCRCGRLRVR